MSKSTFVFKIMSDKGFYEITPEFGGCFYIKDACANATILQSDDLYNMVDEYINKKPHQRTCEHSGVTFPVK